MTILGTLRKQARNRADYALLDIVALLEKGYGVDDDLEGLPERYGDIEAIPAKPEPLSGTCYMAVRKHKGDTEEFLDYRLAARDEHGVELHVRAQSTFLSAPVVRIAKVRYAEEAE